jgi:hypothetical protein
MNKTNVINLLAVNIIFSMSAMEDTPYLRMLAKADIVEDYDPAIRYDPTRMDSPANNISQEAEIKPGWEVVQGKLTAKNSTGNDIDSGEETDGEVSESFGQVISDLVPSQSRRIDAMINALKNHKPETVLMAIVLGASVSSYITLELLQRFGLV